MANLYAEVVDQCIKKLGDHYSFKPKQFEAIDHILRGRDTLAILPTGYGKSLIYQLLPSHIKSWGLPSSETGDIFREAFSRIGDLRSFCNEKVPILALSATVNIDFTELIIATCKLRNLKIVHSCSDRPNIRLSHVSLPEKSPLCFQWVVDQLREYRRSCPKILIYCRTQSLLFWLYAQVRFLLKGFAYIDDVEKTPENCLVGMYHSNTLDPNKALVLNSLTKNEGNIRVVFATSSLGCGIDCKNLSYVFHFGPSNSTIEYCQQIGRAGRDTL
ncbi:bifunctional 3'-5' exonuclease/ATP-dependent helicase WRN-like [Clytia hemisphaerica]|uniref:bifunctional 3'-5' exonuclease/ATP-dependent helicase WRN-like n=1 Tax=Clytia hemisphaerica TaxID=252671 RepID=UPI0034D7061F